MMTSVKRYSIWEVCGVLLYKLWSTRLYERRQPEVPGVLRIVRGYLLIEAMNQNVRSPVLGAQEALLVVLPVLGGVHADAERAWEE